MYISVDWLKIINISLNFLLNSIPEELFLIMFSLYMLRQFDFLSSLHERHNKFKYFDIAHISIPVLLTAIVSNVLRYFVADPNIILLFSITTAFFTVLITYKLYDSVEEILKTIVFTILSFMLLMLIEFSYIPIVLYAMNKTIADFNNNIFYNFLLALPERVIEFSLLTYLLLKKATFYKVSIIKEILKSKLLLFSTSIFLVINLLAFAILWKVLVADRILVNCSLTIQITVLLAALMQPMLNLFLYALAIYCLTKKIKSSKEDVNVCIQDIKVFAKRGNYDKMLSLIVDLEKELETLM